MPPRRAPVAGEVQDGGSPFGELGAKNLLLRRRTPLSPLATNRQHAGGSASGSAAALGGVAALGAAAAGMLPRSTDGLRVCSAPEAGFRSPGALLCVGVPGASPGRRWCGRRGPGFTYTLKFTLHLQKPSFFKNWFFKTVV